MDAYHSKQDNPWSNSGSAEKKKSNVEDFTSRRTKKMGGKPPFTFPKNISPFWVIFAALFLWLISGFYQIEPYEQGLVLRFGKWVRTSDQGIHYRLPAPIEEVVVVDVTSTHKMEIGFNNPNESHMLTGDRNIVDVNVIVQWNIKDAEKFVFNVNQPRMAIKAATESALREVVGKTPVDTTFTSGRAEIQSKTKEMVQRILDKYQSGVHIAEISLDKVSPPDEVIGSFREVEAAEAYQKQVINKAESYRNTIVPQARGEAAKITEEAIGYRDAAIAKATGDVAYFGQLAKEHRKNPGLMETRLKLETYEKVFKGAKKVIVGDQASSSILPHMKLPNAN